MLNDSVFTTEDIKRGQIGVLFRIARLARETAERSDVDHGGAVQEIEKMARECREFYS